MIIGCLGGGMKELRTNIKRILKNYCDDNELDIIANEMQKTVLWESESIIRKTLSGLLTWSVFYLANKIWWLKFPPGFQIWNPASKLLSYQPMRIEFRIENS